MEQMPKERFFLPNWRGTCGCTVTEVVPLPDAVLNVTFKNGVVKLYDFKKAPWMKVWKEDGKPLEHGSRSCRTGVYSSLGEDEAEEDPRVDRKRENGRRVSVVEEMLNDEEFFRCVAIVGGVGTILVWNDDFDVWTEHIWEDGETIECPMEYTHAVEDRRMKAESELDALARLLTDTSDALPCVKYSDWECPVLVNGACVGCVNEQECFDVTTSRTGSKRRKRAYQARDHRRVCKTLRKLGDPAAYAEWKRQRKYETDSLGVMDCWRAYAAAKCGWDPVAQKAKK